jgi:flavin reductase (DIM6/NTAB) family NADH-FMN oxidoreductase RutF
MTSTPDVDIDPFVAPLDYPMLVVTVAGDASERASTERDGCLVGFATQCSIQPARFLVCLSKANRTYRLAAAAPVLAVHLLSRDQLALARLFGEHTADDIDKFTRCGWRPGPHGVPLLDDCPHRLVATVLDRTDLGDHTGFLLAPLVVESTAGIAPLMFSAARRLEAGHPA